MASTQATEKTTLTRYLSDEDEPHPFDTITHLKKRNFLIAYSQLGNIVRACDVSQCSRYSVYLWRIKDPDFVKCFEVAAAMAGEVLEAELYERAVRPNFPSDTLGIFLLKGMWPSKYGDRQRMELTGKDGGPVKMDYSKLSDEQLAQLEQLVALATAKPAEIEPPTVDTNSEVVQPFPILSQENPTSSHPDRAAQELTPDRATIVEPSEGS